MKILESVFKSSDLNYCSIPIPAINDHKDGVFEFTPSQVSNYGQSQTHPSIVYIPSGWNGHKYWLACTPYPKATGAFENPCIYYGDEDVNGNPPRIFTPISGVANGEYTMVNNPVVRVPNNNTTNSDPDLFFDSANSIMYLISRKNVTNFPTYIQKSLDGQSWTPREPTPIINGEIQGGNGQPSIIQVGNTFRSYYTSGALYTTLNREKNQGLQRISIIEGTTLVPPYNFKFTKLAYISGKRLIEPYHSDVFFDEAKSKYYLITTAKNYNAELSGYFVYLAESTDGYNWNMFSRPLFDSMGSNKEYYRPTACIRSSDRKLIIYWSLISGASTVAADYPNGISDMPIDNRAIGVSYKDFDDVLYMLKKDNIISWV